MICLCRSLHRGFVDLLRKRDRLSLYVHVSRTQQTPVPLTIDYNISVVGRTTRPLPVYSQPSELQFLVLDWKATIGTIASAITIDLRIVNESSLLWSDFHVPLDMPASEGFGRSCRTRESNMKFVIEWAVADVFRFFMAVVLFFWWRIKRISNRPTLENESPQNTVDERCKLEARS